MTRTEFDDLKAGVEKALDGVPKKRRGDKLVTVKATQILDLFDLVSDPPAADPDDEDEE